MLSIHLSCGYIESIYNFQNHPWAILGSPLEKTFYSNDYQNYRAFSTERQSRLKRSPNGGITFNQYHQHEEINEYLEKLQKENSNVEVKTVGKSFEGREIKTIKISNGDGGNKNSIFIDAGIHARKARKRF